MTKNVAIKVLFSFLAVTLLTGVYFSRKPLCIDSKVISRFDFVDFTTTQSVWSCEQFKETEWSLFFSQSLKSLNARVQSVESQLERIKKYNSELEISVMQKSKTQYEFSENQLIISKEMLNAEGHLERALVKKWVREQNPRLEKNSLLEEVLTDFVHLVINKDTTYEDPLLQSKTRLNSRWPFVVKDVEGYCLSAWKTPEHYSFCLRDKMSLSEISWQMSTRSFLTSILWNSWSNLSLDDQVQIYLNLPKTLNKLSNLRLRETSMASSAEAVHQFIQHFETTFAQGEPAFQRLVSYLKVQALKGGFSETANRVSFDILIISEENLGPQSELIKSLAQQQTSPKPISIAVKDPQSLWILPNKRALKLDDVSALRAHKIAVLKCGRFDFDWVFSFEGLTEKLLVIDSCGSQKPHLANWINGKTDEFAEQNPKLKFVQFHIPSLSARRKLLDTKVDVISILQNRNLSDPAFLWLGWQELRWSSSAKAFYPQADVEGIELFRL